MGTAEMDNAAGEMFRFQVNLGGMLDILSNHLYKSPDVFLRELLQNGIDAVTLRQKRQPGWTGGRITITLRPGEQMEFRDNGAGLTEEEIHRFLAVIGQSSKTLLEADGTMPEDFIGRFGIGLLSCFMVSDSIVIETQPAEGGQACRWTGFPDGTYTLEPMEVGVVGTAVILTAKAGAERYFYRREVERLVRYYGLALPIPVMMAGEREPLNRVPVSFATASRSQLLSFGEWLFGEEFLEVIPIATRHLSGVAYVLPYRTDPSARGGHRIFLKQMLLTEKGDTLMPPWAFFLRCFLNTQGLRPTASREDFYEDDSLEEARREFAGAVRDHLKELSQEEPERLRALVEVHAQALKSMAVWDDELFRLFIDYLPFETSEGRLTGRTLKKAGEAVCVESVPRFQQLKPVFLSQGRLLICTGYVYDQELIQKLARLCGLPISPLAEDQLELVLEQPTLTERQQAFRFLREAGQVLAPFDCRGEVRRFLPADLPTLYTMNDNARFLRQVQTAQERESDFSDALSSLFASRGEEEALATLCFNLNNDLVRRILDLTDPEALEDVVRVLYVQALLAGGHPLRGQELRMMNEGILGLLGRGI